MKRVTGIGGIFFKARDPQALAAWYKQHLGIDMQAWGGAMFRWEDLPTLNKDACNLISFFKSDTSYMQPSEKEFMLNFVVDNLDLLADALRSEGVQVLDTKEEAGFGKFAWIMDPEGNKVELWEPAAGE